MPTAAVVLINHPSGHLAPPRSNHTEQESVGLDKMVPGGLISLGSLVHSHAATTARILQVSRSPPRALLDTATLDCGQV